MIDQFNKSLEIFNIISAIAGCFALSTGSYWLYFSQQDRERHHTSLIHFFYLIGLRSYLENLRASVATVTSLLSWVYGTPNHERSPIGFVTRRAWQASFSIVFFYTLVLPAIILIVFALFDIVFQYNSPESASVILLIGFICLLVTGLPLWIAIKNKTKQRVNIKLSGIVEIFSQVENKISKNLLISIVPVAIALFFYYVFKIKPEKGTLFELIYATVIVVLPFLYILFLLLKILFFLVWRYGAISILVLLMAILAIFPKYFHYFFIFISLLMAAMIAASNFIEVLNLPSFIEFIIAIAISLIPFVSLLFNEKKRTVVFFVIRSILLSLYMVHSYISKLI